MKAASRRESRRRTPLLFAGLALAGLALGTLARGAAAEPWYIAFMIMTGFSLGSLGLLMIGHLLGESWLAPVREELEAAALTAPLLVAFALPLGFRLEGIFPWAGGAADALPPGRRVYFGEAFFLARSAVWLVAWGALAVWIVSSRRPRRASALGLAVLLPTAVFASNDWAMSRNPDWWSSLFGFAFATSQLLGALAAAILTTLLFDPRAHSSRLQSLERALVVLALLTMWIWFCQFLIVWLANLPVEAAWYVRRGDSHLLPLVIIALTCLAVALVVLLPTGVGRASMLVGSALLLIHHVAHVVWILAPSPIVSVFGLAAGAGLIAIWTAWFALKIRLRPSFADEALRPADGAPV